MPWVSSFGETEVPTLPRSCLQWVIRRLLRTRLFPLGRRQQADSWKAQLLKKVLRQPSTPPTALHKSIVGRPLRAPGRCWRTHRGLETITEDTAMTSDSHDTPRTPETTADRPTAEPDDARLDEKKAR